MTIWKSGRESELLDEIIAGRKTIEGRLNRGKFADYRIGDHVALRRDHRDPATGILHDGDREEVLVEIIGIRQYPSFIDMVTAEGYERVIPNAADTHAAAAIYNKYYSVEDQTEYGVLAIEIHFLNKI